MLPQIIRAYAYRDRNKTIGIYQAEGQYYFFDSAKGFHILEGCNVQAMAIGFLDMQANKYYGGKGMPPAKCEFTLDGGNINLRCIA